MKTLRARLAGGGLVVADQALVSLANFSTTVFLVRGLGLEAFGRFSLLWMGVVFVQGLQLACVGTPMMTVGPKEDRAGGGDYYRAVLRLELGFLAIVLALGALLAPLLARAAGLVPRPGELAAVLALALSRAAYDFIRQRGFARERRRDVLRLDALVYCGQVAVLAGLLAGGRLSVLSALLGLAVPSLLGALGSSAASGLESVPKAAVRAAFLRHAGMSKWLVALSVVQWFTSNAFAVAAGAVLGPAAVGAIKAGQTVMGGLHVLLLAMENVVPVRSAVFAARKAWAELRDYMVRVAVLGGACTLAVSATVASSAGFLSRLLYGHASAEQILAVRGFAVLYVFAFAISLMGIHFRTQERTRPIFLAQALAALVSAVAARPVVDAFGLEGAVVGMVVQQAGIFLLLLLSLRPTPVQAARAADGAARP